MPWKKKPDVISQLICHDGSGTQKKTKGKTRLSFLNRVCVHISIAGPVEVRKSIPGELALLPKPRSILSGKVGGRMNAPKNTKSRAAQAADSPQKSSFISTHCQFPLHSIHHRGRR
jgi:hypothetical protein